MTKTKRTIVSLYFRKTYIVGIENIPTVRKFNYFFNKDCPTIFCGNHSNQFIDPMMIMANTDRKLSFTIAASSFSKPVIGPVAKSLKSIPVFRPEDNKVKAKGKIVFENSTNIKVKKIIKL